MTQIERGSLGPDDEVITTYCLGSVLGGGGGWPDTGNLPEDWVDMYDHYNLWLYQCGWIPSGSEK